MTTTKQQKGSTLRPGGAACLCDKCGEYFANAIAFDAHQKIKTNGDVVCLTPKQMTTKAKSPLAKNSYGYWTRASNLAANRTDPKEFLDAPPPPLDIREVVLNDTRDP